jgi:tryptophan synthase alpha subunit
MNLHQHLRQRIAEGRKLLVPYVCAGFPSEDETLAVLEALADAGADAIELGIPFSDPLMDGPVIQAAASRALAQGMTLPKALALAKAFTARRSTPLLLMSSLNPLLRMGPEAFARRSREAGITGCIIPDLPPESRYLLPGAPPLVQLVAPNTPADRLQELIRQDPPFLYGVSVFGVTGARSALADYTLPFLARTKAATDIPLLAGFGVSTTEQAQEVAEACDGVIIGSALLRALEGEDDPATAARRFLAPFREALGALALQSQG